MSQTKKLGLSLWVAMLLVGATTLLQSVCAADGGYALGRIVVILRQDCSSEATVMKEGDPCDPESQHRTNALELLVRGQFGSLADRVTVWRLPNSAEAAARANETLRAVASRGTVDLWVLPEGKGSPIDAVVEGWLAVDGLSLHRLIWSGGERPGIRDVHADVESRIVVPADPRVARAGWIDFVEAMASHEKNQTSPSAEELGSIWKRAIQGVHSQRMAVGLTGQLVPWVNPGSRPQSGRVSGATLQEGWRFYETAFPHPLTGISGEVDEEGEQAWIDGDGLKLLSSQIEKFLGPVGKKVLGAVMGVRLVSKPDGVLVSLHSKSGQTISWDQPEAILGGRGSWTGFSLPLILRARVRFAEGVLHVDATREKSPFLVNLSVQGFPLGVEFRSANLNLDSGEYQVEAGLFGGALRLVAHGKLFSKQWDGIDFWESVRRSLGGWSTTPAVFQETSAQPN